MFSKVATTPFIECFVQAAVARWVAGEIHGRDLTSSICKIIEDDCDVRFSTLKTKELAATTANSDYAAGPLQIYKCYQCFTDSPCVLTFEQSDLMPDRGPWACCKGKVEWVYEGEAG